MSKYKDATNDSLINCIALYQALHVGKSIATEAMIELYSRNLKIEFLENEILRRVKIFKSVGNGYIIETLNKDLVLLKLRELGADGLILSDNKIQTTDLNENIINMIKSLPNILSIEKSVNL
jgi:hypothetical protein